jgi:hypothetical protein
MAALGASALEDGVGQTSYLREGTGSWSGAPERTARVADGLAVHDAPGRKMDIDIYVGSGRRTTDRSPTESGKSNTMSVSDAARTLGLLKGEVETSRTPLKLEPGETTKVKL